MYIFNTKFSSKDMYITSVHMYAFIVVCVHTHTISELYTLISLSKFV
jgi:hypothetical protein